jgi:hypothetical protein
MSENQIWQHFANKQTTALLPRVSIRKISLRRMRVSDLYANEALHVQNEKSKAAMLNRPDSYLKRCDRFWIKTTEDLVYLTVSRD